MRQEATITAVLRLAAALTVVCGSTAAWAYRAPIMYAGSASDGAFAGDMAVRTIRIPYDSAPTFYAALNWANGTSGGYCGPQNHPLGHEFQFSQWDAPGGGPSMPFYASPGTKARRFTTESTGVAAQNFTLGWTPGQDYTTVVRMWDVGSHTLIGFWLHQVTEKVWTHVGTFDYPVPGARWDNPSGGFMEDFYDSAQYTRRLELKEGWKRNAATLAWTPLGICTLTVSDDPSNPYNDRFNAGIQNGYYFVESGGGTTPDAVWQNGAVRSIDFAKTQPATPPDPTIDFSIASLRANRVSWTVPASSTPQMRYTIKVNGGQVASEFLPEARSAPIVPPASPGATVEVTLEDIYGRTATRAGAAAAGTIAYTVYPLDWQLAQGTYVSGSPLGDTWADDGYFLVVRGASVSTVDFVLGGAGEAAPAALGFSIIGKANDANVDRRFYLYNWVTSAWDLKASDVLGASEVTKTFAVTGATSSYVASGTVRLRVQAFQSGCSNAVDLSYDQVGMSVTP